MRRILLVGLVNLCLIGLVLLFVCSTNYNSDVPQYVLSPLTSDMATWSNIAGRFNNKDLLTNVYIPKLIKPDEPGKIPPEELKLIRRLVDEKYGMFPCRLEKVEIVESNNVYIIVKPNFGISSQHKLHLEKESGQWCLFTGELYTPP